MSSLDPTTLAAELRAAYADGSTIAAPPSRRGAEFTLADAYDVERELVQRRHADGHRAVGLKVGYANKALWRVFKLETLVWAHMYDDTVHYAPANRASLPVGRMHSAKIEPEIVFKMREPLGPLSNESQHDAATTLAHVEWLALGFEIIDNVYADWKFQPADFVAASGLHAALIVGKPMEIHRAMIPALAAHLSGFTVKLRKDEAVVAEGSAKHSMQSPALCLAELGSALARQPVAAPLRTGDLVSSGTLTESMPIAAGQTWTAELNGLDLPPLTIWT